MDVGIPSAAEGTLQQGLAGRHQSSAAAFAREIRPQVGFKVAGHWKSSKNTGLFSPLVLFGPFQLQVARSQVQLAQEKGMG